MKLEKYKPAPPLVGFRARKAAQLAAYFLLRNDGPIDKLKLTKMLYLTERESIAARGRPMLYDECYSLKDGPIVSSSLNGINGLVDEKTWNKYLKLEGAKSVQRVDGVRQDDLDELSKSDMRIAISIWKSFGWMSTSDIRDYTHKNCPEYTEVKSGRIPILYEEIADAVGAADAEEMGRHIREYRSLEAVLGR